MNYLVSAEAGSAHSCELSAALKRRIQLESIYSRKSAYNLEWIDPYGKIGKQYLPESGEMLIIVSSMMYNLMKKKLKNFDRIILIISDSVWHREYKRYNEEWKPFELFFTNCQMQLAENEHTKVYYQPFNLAWAQAMKYSKITLCHSPYSKLRYTKKGSDRIIAAFKNTGLSYDIVSGLKDWTLCIQRKAKCHIFVDQIDTDSEFVHPDWKGGVGKSGLEAMCLKNYTISRGNFMDYDIPAPPMVECTKLNFEEVLFNAIQSDIKPTVEKQYAWAIKYLNPDYCAKRVLSS